MKKYIDPITCGVAFTGVCLTALLLGGKTEPQEAPQETTTGVVAEIENYTLPAIKEMQVTVNININIPCIWGNFNITPKEYELICRTVYCEAGNQDIETQIMTALTILNRLKSDLFPDNITDVIYASGAYKVTEIENFTEYGWTESVEMAVAYALEVNEYPQDMYYFKTRDYHIFGQPYMQSGELYFSTEE